MLVTGSARLDTFRKAGDSLAGRFFQFRLHPLDLNEIEILWNQASQKNLSLSELFERFWVCGPFPDPFLKGSETYYRRWRRSHIDSILRQDLQDLSQVRDIQLIETLVSLLNERVGSPISAASLARDLQKDPHTIRKWLDLLESLYLVFKVTPYHKNVARSILKEPKYYFFDFCQVTHSEGAKFENLVACALYKQAQFIEDTQGHKVNLHYVRTRDGKEIDFLLTKESAPIALIEAKLNDSKPSSNFNLLAPFFLKQGAAISQLQIVKQLQHNQDWPQGVKVVSAPTWLISGIEDLI